MLRKVLALAAVPFLTFVALAAWALASPVGAGPDDDYHLVSVWCTTADGAEHCADAAETGTAMAPEGLVRSSACYAFDSEQGASCQEGLDFALDNLISTDRGNFYGAYPGLYYTVMGWFAGGDIHTSVVLMRFINVTLFVGLTTALFWLLPLSRRSTLVGAWLLTTVPVGMFFIASNNPSAWAILGVGTSWLALVGWYEQRGKTRIALGALFALSVVMATGARGDAAIYTVLGILTAVILTFRRDRRYAIDSILPAAGIAFCIWMFRVSRPIESITGGLEPEAEHSPLALFVNNVLQTPLLWSGVFGNQWGLGWVDTGMPAVVWLATLASFIGVGFLALNDLSRRKLFVVLAGLAVLWALPVTILTAAGDPVGENLQPRYLVPLVVLFAGVLLFSPRRQHLPLTRVQRGVVGLSLAAAYTIALQVNLQRYVYGLSDINPNLDADPGWWWGWGPSPMTVWIIGTLAYAAAVTLLLRTRHTPRILTADHPDADRATPATTRADD